VSRRLLGYVLKRPDGTRSGIVGADPIHDMTLSREDRTACYWVPVFAVRKPKPAPPVAEAEGRYAVLNANGGDVWFEDFDRVDDPTRHVGTRKEALALRPHPHLTPEVVRILPDGEHEAAIAAAREEGFAEAVRLVRAEAENERQRGYHVLKTELRRLADHLENETSRGSVPARKEP
jgi:hypothetical protein